MKMLFQTSFNTGIIAQDFYYNGQIHEVEHYGLWCNIVSTGVAFVYNKHNIKPYLLSPCRCQESIHQAIGLV